MVCSISQLSWVNQDPDDIFGLLGVIEMKGLLYKNTKLCSICVRSEPAVQRRDVERQRRGGRGVRDQVQDGLRQGERQGDDHHLRNHADPRQSQPR